MGGRYHFRRLSPYSYYPREGRKTKAKYDKKDGLFQVIHDPVHNSYDLRQYELYKTDDQTRNKYFGGEMSADNALKLLEKTKYDVEKEMYGLIQPIELKDGDKVLGKKQLQKPYFGIEIGTEEFYKYAALETHRNYIEKIINEINEAEAEKVNEAKSKDFEDCLFIKICKENHPAAYQILKKAKKANIVALKNGKIDFAFKALWQINRFFKEAGFTEWKEICKYITYNGKPVNDISLETIKTSGRNSELKWNTIKQRLSI